MASKIARIINGKVVYVDQHASVALPSETEARASREDQRVKYRKEMLQKNEVAYYKAYPEQAENLSAELRRLLS